MKAFPVAPHGSTQEGMDLRDYFAAFALNGLLSNPHLRDEIIKKGGSESGWLETSAYSFADEMIKIRGGKNE